MRLCQYKNECNSILYKKHTFNSKKCFYYSLRIKYVFFYKVCLPLLRFQHIRKKEVSFMRFWHKKCYISFHLVLKN